MLPDYSDARHVTVRVKMTKDEYVELVQDYPYEVRKFHGDKHIMINPQQYRRLFAPYGGLMDKAG